MDAERHLKIGSLLFDGIDQIDLTGPYEVLSRLPETSYQLYSPDGSPVRDVKGLGIVADGSIDDAPDLDVLHVPGGPGQQALMKDERVLTWLRRQAGGAKAVLSVCTGALLLGAAGLLRDRRVTTHWASFHLLPCFGAIPVDARVVVDQGWVFAAGVTSGIDGALRLAAQLRGETAAKAIQLHMVYAPEPPFDAGTPDRAPIEVVTAASAMMGDLISQREKTAIEIAGQMGISAMPGPRYVQSTQTAP